jgi:hypothetical protein
MDDSELGSHAAFREAVQDCLEALAVSADSLGTSEIDFTQYKLISVENLIHVGPAVWSLTFKLRKLIPINSHSVLGAGGEIFVQVDVQAKTVNRVNYGE